MRHILALVGVLAATGCSSFSTYRDPFAGRTATTTTTAGAPLNEAPVSSAPLSPPIFLQPQDRAASAQSFSFSNPAPLSLAQPAVAPTLTEALLNAERALIAAAQARGLGAAVAEALDPIDGFVAIPGRLVQGEQVIEALSPPANAGQMFWQSDRVFTSAGGDLGMTSGRFAQVLRGAEAIQGRYIATWRRDVQGDWRILSFNMQADPRGTPAAPTATTRRR